jgi:hypothetical protein
MVPAAAGSIRYHGLDGQPFSVVKNLYNMRYTNDHDTAGAEPYLRVFTKDVAGAEHGSICTANGDIFGDQMKNGSSLGPGPFQEYVATSGSWRYDSDDGSNSEFGRVPLSDILAKVWRSDNYSNGYYSWLDSWCKSYRIASLVADQWRSSCVWDVRS